MVQSDAQAAVYGVPSTVTAPSEFSVDFGVNFLFDAAVANSDVGSTLYGTADGQYAGLGVGPHNVFMDFGCTLADVDGLAYSQRLGGDPAVDKVTQIELWFSDSDFGETLPGSPSRRHGFLPRCC